MLTCYKVDGGTYGSSRWSLGSNAPFRPSPVSIYNGELSAASGQVCESVRFSRAGRQGEPSREP